MYLDLQNKENTLKIPNKKSREKKTKRYIRGVHALDLKTGYAICGILPDKRKVSEKERGKEKRKERYTNI